MYYELALEKEKILHLSRRNKKLLQKYRAEAVAIHFLKFQ